ncbi:hypothetical protein HII31_09603 [Pseudocercospora fuligena]|uniref:Uncharacterized protein n=1 Tax=Pseudocercospora fuligena TaxID=685502 RepID=A0A8H6RAU1_9PEZI|nr:hypothetical protein HII31_09603 [Pseudocercospora fuligena]
MACSGNERGKLKIAGSLSSPDTSGTFSKSVLFTLAPLLEGEKLILQNELSWTLQPPLLCPIENKCGIFLCSFSCYNSLGAHRHPFPSLHSNFHIELQSLCRAAPCVK